jgi:hypothetical protein
MQFNKSLLDFEIRASHCLGYLSVFTHTIALVAIAFFRFEIAWPLAAGRWPLAAGRCGSSRGCLSCLALCSVATSIVSGWCAIS